MGVYLPPPPPQKKARHHHHHNQSLFIHEIESFYMVFIGIVFKTRLKHSKELLTTVLKIQKLTLWIIRKAPQFMSVNCLWVYNHTQCSFYPSEENY